MSGSPSGPGPSLCLRTIVARTPLRRSTSPVPSVAQISKPRSARRFTGKTMDRLSRLATDTNTRPLTGSGPYAAACDFAYAVPNTASMPITSPVERISGPSTVSTPWPLRVAEPAERQHRLLDRDRRVQRQRAAVPGRGQHALGAQLGDAWRRA